MKKYTLFVDMDGTLAKWDANASEEETHQEGFFASREPEEALIGAINRLHKERIDLKINILTCAYDVHAVWEKMEWLKKYDLHRIPITFVPYGKRKWDYIPDDIDANASILLDDFGKNLREWCMEGGNTIKFYNGINGNGKTQYEYSVNANYSESEMVNSLNAIIDSILEEVYA